MFELTREEINIRMLKGSTYKEYLEEPSNFWWEENPDVKWKYRYFDKHRGVEHKTSTFYSPTECNPGKYLYDLIVDNTNYIFKRFENGILRITK